MRWWLKQWWLWPTLGLGAAVLWLLWALSSTPLGPADPDPTAGPPGDQATCTPSPLVAAADRPTPGNATTLRGIIRDPADRQLPVVISLVDESRTCIYQYFCDRPGRFQVHAPATSTDVHLLAFLDVDSNGPSPSDASFETTLRLDASEVVELEPTLRHDTDLGDLAPWLDRGHGNPVADADTEVEVRMQLEVRHEDPDDVMRLLAPLDGEVIADVGCGAGFYTFRLAQAVGAGGRVVALDVRDDLLERLRLRASRDPALDPHGVVETRHSRLDDTTLAPGAVQTCFLSHLDFYVYPDLPDEQQAFLRSCRQSITPDGRVVVVQWMGVQPPGTTEDLVRNFEGAGLTLRSSERLPGHDTWLFVFAQAP